MRTALTLMTLALVGLTAKAGDYCQRAVAVTKTVTYAPATVAVAADYCQTTTTDVADVPVLLNRGVTYGGVVGVGSYGYGYANQARRVTVVKNVIVRNEVQNVRGARRGGGFGGGGGLGGLVDSVGRLVNSPAGQFALGAFVSRGFRFK
jgi:hypothetical protein